MRPAVHIASLFLSIALASAPIAYAQDIHNFTQFYFNPALLNSSYVGIEGQPVLFLSYKKQWAGLEGSPTLANLNVQTSLPSQVGLGLNISNDRNGLLSSTALLVQGSYNVQLAKDQFLRFGLSMGLSSTKVDIAALTFNTPGDPILATLAQTNMQPVGNLGLSFHSKTFHGGVALPSIFQAVYLQNTSFSVGEFSPFQSVIIHASNRFYFAKDKNVFEPYVIYRLNNGIPSQFEAAGIFHFQNVVYAGGSYKQNFGISGILGFKLNKIAALGYSYTLKSTGINEMNRPSHEVQLALVFGKRPKEVVASYSFVNTEKEKIHRKTPQEIAAEKKKREAELAKKQQEEAAKKQLAEQQKKEAEAAAAAAAAAALAKENARAAAKLDSSRKAHVNLTDEQHLQRLEDHAENPTEEHDELHHGNAERHEIVKRGGHHAEMDLGDYVISGVFGQEANAKRFSDGLIKLGFKDADYGFLTANKLWYVHIAETDNIDAARASRDKYRKMKIFRDAWLLTVQK